LDAVPVNCLENEQQMYREKMDLKDEVGNSR
jgi:hypothetical protein